MARRSARRFVVLLAALALLTAGCGGGGGGGESSSPPLTKAQYQTKLQQLSREVGAEVRQSIGPSTKLKESDIPKLQDSLRSLAGKLAALNPPTAVQDLHQQLVAAVRALAADLPKIAGQVNKAQDASAAIAALFGAKSIQALLKLQQEYKDKGYDISSLLDAGSGP